jgi:hypothetical protein
MALVSFPLLRKGSLKDWAIRALLLTSVGLALAIAILELTRILRAYAPGNRLSLYYGLELLVPIVLLAAFFAWLVGNVLPRWCPACSRPMLMSVSQAAVPRRMEREPVRVCLACHGLFKKGRRSWELVETKSDTGCAP